MSNTIYFTPGPAQLYPTVASHINNALLEDIASISHRSKKFHEIYRHTDSQLRELLGLPADFFISFTGSATEIWERALQSLVIEHSYHLVNGSFSKKFHSFAKELGKKPQKLEAEFGKGFFHDDVKIGNEIELVCATANETSAGVYTQESTLVEIKRKNTDALLIVDAVSAVPFSDFDWDSIDSILFSVQKAFGLPAGLGVWVYNQKCLQKADKVIKEGCNTGTYHSLLSLYENTLKYETPETPNVLGIYLLGKVAEDMNKIGKKNLRSQTLEKAKMMYQFLEKNDSYSAFVKEPLHQSPTVIVANTSKSSKDVIAKVIANCELPISLAIAFLILNN